MVASLESRLTMFLEVDAENRYERHHQAFNSSLDSPCLCPAAPRLHLWAAVGDGAVPSLFSFHLLSGGCAFGTLDVEGPCRSTPFLREDQMTAMLNQRCREPRPVPMLSCCIGVSSSLQARAVAEFVLVRPT